MEPKQGSGWGRVWRRWRWELLALSAVLLRAFLPPTAIEWVYSRGLFQGVRLLFDGLSALCPFPMVYLLAVLLLGWLFWKAHRFWRHRLPPRVRWLRMGKGLLSFFSAVVFFFLLLWGFNYGRLPVHRLMGFPLEELSLKDLRAELEHSTGELVTFRATIPGAGEEALAPEWPPGLVDTMRRHLTAVLAKAGLPVRGRVRLRMLKPRGILLRISTAGVYIPFTGEGHADAGLHPLQLPFVAAHELAHGYGFGDEGTCNFLAYLACRRAEDPRIRYAGQLAYWRYVGANYRFYDPEGWQRFFEEQVPPGVKNDLEAIWAEMEKYPDLFPRLRDAAYDTYLKAQGIEEGQLNYSKVIGLVWSWRRMGGSAE